jgi:hypothetical protein
MLDLKIKSGRWEQIFLETELAPHIKVRRTLNTSSESVASYDLIINDRCVQIENPKHTARCILEVAELGGFDELLLDSCGGYAKLVRVHRQGLPTYFIHPPSFKLGRNSRGLNSRLKASSVSSFSRLDDSASNSEEDVKKVPLKLQGEPFKTVAPRQNKVKSNGLEGGAAVVGIVGFAFIVGTMAYVLSNSEATNKKRN